MFPLARKVTLLEQHSVIVASGTTGFRTWEAALHFGSFLCTAEGSSYIQGKRVMELGAGTGLLSILCAKWLEAKSVLATDGSTEVVEGIEENIFLNELDTSSNIKARQFRWGQVLGDDEEGETQAFDVVLGADIVRY
jgi:predicted nicotinamide N-methyase